MFTREVWRYVLPLILLGGIAHYFFVALAIPFYILAIVLLYLFRLPKADIPSCALCVVSPVDGEVVSIEKTTDPYLNRNAVKICMESAISGSYALRSVTEGKIMQYLAQARAGNGNSEKKESRHARAVWIQTDEKDDVVLVMYPGRLNKIHCYVAMGDRIGIGQQCGTTPFGGKIDIYLPENTRLHVKAKSKAQAGADIIAEWNHQG